MKNLIKKNPPKNPILGSQSGKRKRCKKYENFENPPKNNKTSSQSSKIKNPPKSSFFYFLNPP